MTADDHLYLDHMRECIERIQAYTAEGRATFEASTLIQDGVIRNLQVMSESSQRISATVKDTHPAIDWRAISGFRNVLVHDYLSIDLNIVWNVIANELPTLKTQVEAVLDEFQEGTED